MVLELDPTGGQSLRLNRGRHTTLSGFALVVDDLL